MPALSPSRRYTVSSASRRPQTIQVESITTAATKPNARESIYQVECQRVYIPSRMPESLYTKSNVRESIYQVECQRVYIPSRMLESLYTKSNVRESIYQVECHRVYIPSRMSESLYTNNAARKQSFKSVQEIEGHSLYIQESRMTESIQALYQNSRP